MSDDWSQEIPWILLLNGGEYGIFSGESQNEGLTDTTITVLSATGATLYTGTHYHGVFRLERDEDLWKPVGSMHRDV